MSAPSPEVIAALSHPSVVPQSAPVDTGFNLSNVGALSGAVLQAPVVPQAPPDNGYASGLPPLGVPIAQQPQPIAAPAVAAPSPEEQAIAAASAAPAAQPVAGGGRVAAPATAAVDPLNSPQVAAADARIAGTEAVANAQTGEQQTTDAAAAETTARNQLAADAQRKLADQHEARMAAEQRVQLLREKAAGAQYHSFWQDKSAGQMVLAGLGILAGGVNWDPHHQNQAVEIIQQGIKQDFQTQEAQHAQLWKDVEAAMQQGQQLSSDQLREMGDFRAQQALKLDAVIAKGREMVSANKAHGETLALKQQLSQLEFNREHALDESIRLHQAAEETKRHNMQEERHQRAEEGIARGHLGVARAKANGDAKAESEIKVTNLVNATLKNKQTPELLKKRDTLEQVVSAIDSGNAVAKGAALDEFTKAATGLGARPSSVKLFESRVGGTFEHFKSILQKAQNGDPLTPEQTKRFRSAAQYLLDETKGQLSSERKTHQAALSSNPVFARHKDILDAAFNNIYGPEAAAAPATSAPAPAQPNKRLQLPDGTIAEFDASGKRVK